MKIIQIHKNKTDREKCKQTRETKDDQYNNILIYGTTRPSKWQPLLILAKKGLSFSALYFWEFIGYWGGNIAGENGGLSRLRACSAGRPWWTGREAAAGLCLFPFSFFVFGLCLFVFWWGYFVYALVFFLLSDYYFAVIFPCFLFHCAVLLLFFGGKMLFCFFLSRCVWFIILFIFSLVYFLFRLAIFSCLLRV